MTEMMQFDVHDEFRRAELYLESGQPTEAARMLEPLVASDPDNEAALELLARSYFASAQLQRAEDALLRLVDRAPSNAWARRALARTMDRQSRRSDSARHHRLADALGAA